jgi:hypothetical protein
MLNVHGFEKAPADDESELIATRLERNPILLEKNNALGILCCFVHVVNVNCVTG